jgi:hypothetical protein
VLRPKCFGRFSNFITILTLAAQFSSWTLCWTFIRHLWLVLTQPYEPDRARGHRGRAKLSRPDRRSREVEGKVHTPFFKSLREDPNGRRHPPSGEGRTRRSKVGSRSLPNCNRWVMEFSPQRRNLPRWTRGHRTRAERRPKPATEGHPAHAAIRSGKPPWSWSSSRCSRSIRLR